MTAPSAHHGGSGWLQTTRREPRGHSYPAVALSLVPRMCWPKGRPPPGSARAAVCICAWLCTTSGTRWTSPGSSAQLVPFPPNSSCNRSHDLLSEKSPSQALPPAPLWMETGGLAPGVAEGTAGQAGLCCPVQHRVEFLLVVAGVALPGLGRGLDGGSAGADIPTCCLIHLRLLSGP